MVHGGMSRKRNNFGIQLDRESATLPATAFGALFDITGGRVVLTSIIGEVTVVIHSQTTNIKITSDPTIGTTVDIATNLDTDADAVNSLYGIATYASAMTGGGAAANICLTPGIVLPIGELGITTGATSTGEIKWSITYIPLDDDAYMTVA